MPAPDPSRPWSVAGTPWIVRPGFEAHARTWLANPRKKLPVAAPKPGAVRPDLVPDYFRGGEVRAVPRHVERTAHYWTGEILEAAHREGHQANGYVIYRGPSRIDGAPIVAIATGFRDPSQNRKTGPMIQTWILREDLTPLDALATGADRSICGDCPHRGGFGYRRGRERKGGRTIESVVRSGVRFKEGGEERGRKILLPYAAGRSCYVVVSQAPQQVWKSYHQGLYPFVSIDKLPDLFAGAYPLRVGSYGEPVAVPAMVWRAALHKQWVWTGYTHGWDRPENQEYRDFLMASVDSKVEQRRAAALGWRTFRIGRKDEPSVAGVEVVCPATPEGGKRVRRAGKELVETTSCDACGLCMGASKKARSIVVAPHGTGARFHEERDVGQWLGETYLPPGYAQNPGWVAGSCQRCGKPSMIQYGVCARCARELAAPKAKPKHRASRMTSDQRRQAKRTWKVGTRVREKGAGSVATVLPDGRVELRPATGSIAAFRTKGPHPQVQVVWDQQARLPAYMATEWTVPYWNLELLPPTAGPLFDPDHAPRPNPGHPHPRVRLPVSRGQVEGELAHLAHEAGLLGQPSVTWPADLTRLHERRPRRYAQVWFAGSEPRYELAEQTRWLPEANRVGVLSHEVGHVLDPEGGELGADLAAEAALGRRITYDPRWPGRGLQSVRL